MTKTILTVALGLALAAGLCAQKQAKVSKKEADAYNAMVRAQGPDEQIKLAEELITKFADTQFKGLALRIETLAYQQKNDFDNMMIAGERALETNPDDAEVLVALAQAISQRTREHDLDKDEKLKKAEAYAKKAQTVIPNMAKPNPQISDDQWTGYKKDMMARSHLALGQIAIVQKNFPVAQQALKAGADVSPEPNAMIFYQLGMAYAGENKYDDAIAAMDKSVAAGGVKAGGRDFAAVQKAAFEKAKASAQPKQ